MKGWRILLLITTLVGRGLTRMTNQVVAEFYDSLAENEIDGSDLKVSQPLCMSKDCQIAAEDILKSIDQKIDPCDNFYQFSCGNFLKTRTYEDEYATVNTNIIEKRLDEIREMDEKLYNLEALRKMRSFTRKCLADGYLDTLKYFRSVLNELGGWPVLREKNWSDSDYNWLRDFRTLKKRNLSVPFPVDTVEDLGLEVMFLRDFHKIKNIGEERLQEMVDLAVTFGANREEAKKDMADCLVLEQQLRRADRESGWWFTLLKDLNKTDIWFPFEEVIRDQVINPRIIERNIIFVTFPALIPKLQKILTTTSNRTQANYMMLRFIESNLEDISWRYLNLMSGRPEDQKWDSGFWCPRMATEHFLIPLLSQYLKKHSDIDHRDDIVKSQIVENIKEQYLKEMMKLPDHYPPSVIATVREFYEKLDITLGYPAIVLNDTYVDELYANFHSENNINFFEVARTLIDIKKKPIPGIDIKDLTDFLEDNAFYWERGHFNKTFNIALALAKISPPYYSNEYPDSINYGRFGTSFAHELGHALIGNPLAESNRTLFNRKCIEDQYSAPGVDGKETNDEDIADNAGFRVAYNAYLTALKQKNYSDTSLPNLKYTPRQMFWISKATAFCQIYSSGDEHSAHKVRINNAFANLQEFRSDFQCTKGSYMYSLNECAGVRR